MEYLQIFCFLKKVSTWKNFSRITPGGFIKHGYTLWNGAEVKFLCEMLENEQIDNQFFEDSLKGLEIDKNIEGIYVQKQLESAT